jgi:hypothetical protein
MYSDERGRVLILLSASFFSALSASSNLDWINLRAILFDS